MSLVKLSKWGNATALRIPKPFLDLLKVNTGEKVKINVVNEQLVISKAGPSLEELLEGCTPENKQTEFFSDSVGKELI